jgi:hypothetical protein
MQGGHSRVNRPLTAEVFHNLAQASPANPFLREKQATKLRLPAGIFFHIWARWEDARLRSNVSASHSYLIT